MKLLHIDSSISGQASASRQLTRQIVDRLVQSDPALAVTYRDLDREPLPHLDSNHLAGMAPGAATGETTRRELAASAAALEEFLAADVVVIGAPMYNFTVSSQLKAWIDRILVAGKTFSYTAEGPKGLAGGKRVIIASSRGGIYASDTAMAAMDFQETYLRAVLRFIGIDRIEFVRAEGVAFGPEQREAALNGAIAAFQPAAARPAQAA
jgi:FMN-dependent NADH-azoreductase